MLGIFIDVLVPVLVVLGVGFVAARTLGAEPDTLAKLSYWAIGPVFIFNLLSGAELDAGDVTKIVGATVLSMVIVAALAGSVGLGLSLDPSMRSASILTSIFGNVGNFGLAITAFALGGGALPAAGIVMVTVNTVGILAGVGLASARSGPWWKAIRAALLTPLALAVLPALAVNLTDTELPVWLARPIELVSAAFIPLLLLTLGIQLAGIRKASAGPPAVLPLILKLAITPIVAFGSAALLGLGGESRQVVILQAAMPSAVFTSLIALEHDLEADFVTSVVLIGTLASAATIPVVISLL